MEAARPSVPVIDERVVSSDLQGYLYIFPKLGYSLATLGPGISFGGQIGYGNESWGRAFIDYLFCDFYQGGRTNIVGLYEPVSESLYWQFGLGFLIGYYYTDPDEDISISGLVARICLGYNFTLGKYIIIRPAIALNLGLEEHQSNLSLNLNFGFKTPNLW